LGVRSAPVWKNLSGKVTKVKAVSGKVYTEKNTKGGKKSEQREPRARAKKIETGVW